MCDAVYASCCVPFVFTPVRYKEYVLCDGALSSYIPQVYPHDLTLHILIPPEYCTDTIDTWMDFMLSMGRLSLVYQRHQIDNIRTSPNCINIHGPLMSGVATLQPRMDPRTLQGLTHTGYSMGVLFLYEDMTGILSGLVLKLLDHIVTFHRLIHSRVNVHDVPDSEYASEDDRCDSPIRKKPMRAPMKNTISSSVPAFATR